MCEISRVDYLQVGYEECRLLRHALLRVDLSRVGYQGCRLLRCALLRVGYVSSCVGCEACR